MKTKQKPKRMPISRVDVVGNSVQLASIRLKDFPDIYNEFVSGVGTGPDTQTLALERKGATLMKNDFANRKRVYPFFLDVMAWGGKSGNRVCGHLKKYNGKHMEERVVKAIIDAGRLLRKRDIAGAIRRMIALKGMHISFGSKVLRMLSPEQVGVYDNVLAVFLDYPMGKKREDDIKGFVDFCADCEKVKKMLNAKKIPNPKREETGGKWLIADVEAVLFYPVNHKIDDIVKKQKKQKTTKKRKPVKKQKKR